MEAQELRLKNLVKYPKYYNDGTDKIWMIRDIFWESDRIGLTDGVLQTKTDLKFIQPIPITEEWLLKFGFNHVSGTLRDKKINIQKEEGSGHSEYDLWIDFGDDNETFEVEILIVSKEGDWFFTKQKYIHQLQNIYFALTKKELTIKTQ